MLIISIIEPIVIDFKAPSNTEVNFKFSNQCETIMLFLALPLGEILYAQTCNGSCECADNIYGPEFTYVQRNLHYLFSEHVDVTAWLVSYS